MFHGEITKIQIKEYQNILNCSGGSRISRREGRGPRRGGVDSRGGYVSQILYVKKKESGPLGGVRRARPLNPPMNCNDKIPAKQWGV